MGFSVSIDPVSPAPPVAPEQTSTSGDGGRGSRSNPRKVQSSRRPAAPEVPPEVPPAESVVEDGVHVNRLA
jgi:hypothetical protein